MKKKLIHILALVLAVTAVFLIHRRVQFEAQEASRLAEEVQSAALLTEKARAYSVLRADKDFTLGRIVENTERGGVDIITTAEDGTQSVQTFTDVSMDSWYANAVNYVVSAGLMNGSSEKPSFLPDYAVQREIFALMLYRFTGSEVGDLSSDFEDVAENMWFYDAVTWATEQGVVAPTDERTFGVGAYMTCEQAIISLYRLAGEPETDGSLADYPYAAKVSESGRAAMDWAWKNGLITEDECVWYPPQAISRAQTALLLMRYSEKIF